jgi:hypothetical protein
MLCIYIILKLLWRILFSGIMMSRFENQPTFQMNMLLHSSGSKYKSSKKPSWEPCMSHVFTLVTFLGSTLKIEAICCFETSVAFQRTTWFYIQEDGTLRNHRCGSTKSYLNIYFNVLLQNAWVIYELWYLTEKGDWKKFICLAFNIQSSLSQTFSLGKHTRTFTYAHTV